MSGEPIRYSPLVRELFGALPGAGAPSPGDGTTVHGESAALDRGAWVRFEARVGGGRILDCAFRAWGCPHTLAAAALLTQAMREMPLAGAAPADARELAHRIGAPAGKLGRLLTVVDAQAALLEAARAVE
jgi:NifU-like protein involved in Fe-S cluster formation